MTAMTEAPSRSAVVADRCIRVPELYDFQLISEIVRTAPDVPQGTDGEQVEAALWQFLPPKASEPLNLSEVTDLQITTADLLWGAQRAGGYPAALAGEFLARVITKRMEFEG